MVKQVHWNFFFLKVVSTYWEKEYLSGRETEKNDY